MARGFESKDVEFQQAESERVRPQGRALSAAEREVESTRRTLALALSKVEADLETATNPHYRQMLEQAKQTLQDQLREGC